MSNHSEEQSVLNRIIDRFVMIWVVLTLPGLAMQLLRSEISQYDLVEQLQTGLIFAVWILLIVKNKLSIYMKAWFGVVATTSMAYLGIYKYGLMAAGFIMIPISAMLLALCFGRKIFYSFLVFNVLALLMFAYGYTNGIIAQPLVPTDIGVNWAQWGVFIITSTLTVYFVGNSLIDYKTELSKKMKVISAQHDEMHKLAYYDHLTDLALMTLAEDKIDQAIALGREGALTAVLFFDLDDFKDINDTLGHDAGDHCLQHFGQAILKSIQSKDIACRIGGDEVIVVCHGLPDLKVVSSLARRLTLAIQNGCEYEGKPLSLSVSVGMAVAPFHGDTFRVLKRKADEALYQAKKGQGGQSVMYGTF